MEAFPHDQSPDDILALGTMLTGGDQPEQSTSADADDALQPKATIVLSSGRLAEIADEAEDALREARIDIYQLGRSLVRPVMRKVSASRGRVTLAAGAEEVGLYGLIDLLSRAVTFKRINAARETETKCDPPERIAKIILSRTGFWSFPVLAGIISTPTLRPDGSLLDTPGYDPATKLYLAADPSLRMPPIPEKPTREDGLAALAVLQELFAGFPLVSALDRAICLSAAVTAIARAAFDVAPMHGFSAPTAGSGKSYLVDVISAIISGRPCPVAAASKDASEAEKQLVSHLLAKTPLISLDNVKDVLDSSLLCQAITQRLVTPRIFGKTAFIEVENTYCLMATGNNLTVAGDLNRRVLIARLDAQVERPELREFDSNPFERVLSDRGQYIAAGLTILKAYLAAGSPDPVLPKLASFEGWSDTVRSALVWLGCADPVASLEEARAEDPVLTQLRNIIDAWREAIGVDMPMTVAELTKRATATRTDPDQGFSTSEPAHPELRAALEAVGGDHRGNVDAEQLGKWLRGAKGRVVGGLRIANIPHEKKAARWFVQKAA